MMWFFYLNFKVKVQISQQKKPTDKLMCSSQRHTSLPKIRNYWHSVKSLNKQNMLQEKEKKRLDYGKYYSVYKKRKCTGQSYTKQTFMKNKDVAK